MDHFFIHKSFSNFDEFAHDVQAWDLDYKQLDRGECKTDMLQFVHGNSQIDYAKYSRRFDQHGSPPPGKWTFAIFSEQTPPIVWHEKEINNNTIAVFKPGSEMDCVVQPGFEAFTVSYTEEHLNEIADNLGLPKIQKLLDGTDTFECSMLELSESRWQLYQLIGALKHYSSGIENISFTHTLDFELPEQILLTLARSVPIISSTMRIRNQAIKLIKQHLNKYPQEPVMVSQLCKITKVSIRTLQYAFLEHYGVTPKTYLKNFRLNGVRRELWKSDPNLTRVNDVASLWSFWHMGEFAADYRKLFCELPSETLQRRK